MPRNVQGIYSLPPGNPVIPGTLIETTWANPTMSDIAAALTGSLPRNGAAPMTGPLVLAGDATVPLEAVPLQQLNAIVGASDSYLPAGAVQLFAMAAVPSGWLECNGAAISRTTYANLFAAIGTLYGAGNSTTTFNLPDLRGEFVRGWDNGRSADPGRAMGSNQAAANNPHTHGAASSSSQASHSHVITTGDHSHGINDPGHTHSGGVLGTPGFGIGVGGDFLTAGIGSSHTGISIAAAGNIGGYTDVLQPTVTTSTTITSEGIEARPRNVAMVYAIKAFGALQTDGLGSMAFQNKEAVNITGGVGAFTKLSCADAPINPTDVARLADIGGSLAAVLSADPQVLMVDNTTPSTPILRPQTNVPNGMAKLDAAGFVPSSIINITDLTFLGMWDASPGLLPTGTFVTGDYYGIDTPGTLTLETSGGSAAVLCNIGDQIIYKTTPIAGWWYSPVAQPADVVPRTSATGAALIPAGTTAERDTTDLGAFRYNLDTDVFEGLSNNGWGQVGGGISQAQADGWYLQLDGGNQMAAPLVFDTGANAVVRVGPAPVAQFPTVCGIAFCKNKLFNGEVTRINQRAFDGNWTPKGTWAPGNTIEQQELCYGYDMWAKASATDMVQPIEAGNFRPSTVHTISGTNMTTRQETSPASGNWNIVVPQAARNVQVEEGLVATPFEIRPISFELAQCQRYYELGYLSLRFPASAGDQFVSQGIQAKAVKRIIPQVLEVVSGTGLNIQTWEASNVDVSGFRYNIESIAAGDSYMVDYKWALSAVI